MGGSAMAMAMMRQMVPLLWLCSLMVLCHGFHEDSAAVELLSLEEEAQGLQAVELAALKKAKVAAPAKGKATKAKTKAKAKAAQKAKVAKKVAKAKAKAAAKKAAVNAAHKATKSLKKSQIKAVNAKVKQDKTAAKADMLRRL